MYNKQQKYFNDGQTLDYLNLRIWDKREWKRKKIIEFEERTADDEEQF